MKHANESKNNIGTSGKDMMRQADGRDNQGKEERFRKGRIQGVIFDIILSVSLGSYVRRSKEQI